MKNILLTLVLLSLPVSAYAWDNTGMHPMSGPNFVPQGQPVHHDVRMNAPRPAEHRTAPVVNRPQFVRHDQVVDRRPVNPGYFRRDENYYGHADFLLPYSDVDISPNFAVPDGFETVIVNGETFYYDQGVFYQQVGNQLTVIPPVLGAVVDSIPQDYQIVMADGVHYLFTDGVYYQRVEQGFEVVQGPGTDQE